MMIPLGTFVRAEFNAMGNTGRTYLGYAVITEHCFDDTRFYGYLTENEHGGICFIAHDAPVVIYEPSAGDHFPRALHQARVRVLAAMMDRSAS